MSLVCERLRDNAANMWAGKTEQSMHVIDRQGLQTSLPTAKPHGELQNHALCVPIECADVTASISWVFALQVSHNRSLLLLRSKGKPALSVLN